MEAAFPLSAGEFRLERVETLHEEGAEVAEPVIELTEWRGIDGIQPPCALRPDSREPALAEDLEVLRHRWLRDAELVLDDGRNRSRRQLAVCEQLEDPPPDWIAENVERVHSDTL